MNAGRGRGGAVMGGNRGGLTGQRGGRGGGVFMGNGSGRGGGAGQQNALRGHGSRGGFGKDFHNRRGGGSFNAGHQHHQNNATFRGRGQGHASTRASRQDGSTSFGNRDASQFASSGKKDENRRTLTDFKIVGLEMPELGWSWGVLPSPIKAEEKEVAASLLDPSPEVKDEEMGTDKLAGVGTPKSETAPVAEAADVKTDASQEQSSSSTPPPSRIRIYFHTPVSPDDSHPIPHNSSYTAPPDTRKGKRKKLEDDDGDAEEGRERPPPPRSSQMDDNVSVDMDGVGRGSAAPSLAETASEGDWLMAAIAEDEGDVGADADGDAATTVDGMDEEERHAASDPHFIPAMNTFLDGDGVGNGELNPSLFFALGGCFRAWGERPFVAQGFNRLTYILKAPIILTWTELPLQEVSMSLIAHILGMTLSRMLKGSSRQPPQMLLLLLTLVHSMLVLSLRSRTWIFWFLHLKKVVITQPIPLLRWPPSLPLMKMLIGSLIHRLL